MGDNGTKPSESAEAPEHQRRGGLIGAAVDLALASIGAAALLREEAQAMYRRSVERGEADVKQLQARLKVVCFPQEVSARAPSIRSRRAVSTSEEWRAALEHLNFPTATQVKVLTQQVATWKSRSTNSSLPARSVIPAASSASTSSSRCGSGSSNSPRFAAARVCSAGTR